MRVIGLMSGTSYDAIDVAAGDLSMDGETLVLRPLGHLSVSYPERTRSMIAATLPPAETTAHNIAVLDTEVGQAFGRAASMANRRICAGRADLVVSHGQTIYHWVEHGYARGSLQVGQPAWIAEETGLPVVSDLRARDIAAGGQGAPLVSFLDVMVLRSLGPGPSGALNIGGIANLTVVGAAREPLAFDTGPGNALIDAAVRMYRPDGEEFDRNGVIAASGQVHPGLLRRLLDDEYYEMPPPKSTGKERFNAGYLLAAAAAVGLSESGPDIVATATRLTAEVIAREVRRFEVRQLLVSGGGIRNPLLMSMLADAAPDVTLRSFSTLGVDEAAKEAYAFAILGYLSLHGVPATIPSCTGARAASVLGSITPGRNQLRPNRRDHRVPTAIRIESDPPAR